MRYVLLFIGFLAVWLLWSGLYTPLVIGLGVVSCLLCVLIARRMHIMRGVRLEPGLAVGSIGYYLWLLKEIAASNLSVIRIVLSPRLPIDPQVIKVKASQRTELGRVIYGNSITLTPGTLTMDVDDDVVTVHALTGAGAEQILEGEMDRRVTRLESRG